MSTATLPAQPRPPAEDTAVPRDDLAERIIIGGALLASTAIADARDNGLQPDDMWKPAHITLWATITKLYDTTGACDPAMVLADLQATKQAARVGGAPYLHDCMQTVPTIANTGWYAQRVHDLARQRTLLQVGQRLVQLGGSPATDRTDVEDALEAGYKTLVAAFDDTPTSAAAAPSRPATIDELLAEDEPEYDWLIPGLLERHDRLIITGPEGGGKSTFLRQLAVMSASGLHPFTGELFPPIRVLLIDLENSRRQVRRKIRPLRLAAGAHLTDQQLYIETRMGGIDLGNRTDLDWILAIAAVTRPDLVCTGPIYKMAMGDPNDEVSAKPVAVALDRLRTEHHCAIAIESHTPWASGGQRKRPLRPFGWSGWARWPEFGIHLAKDGEIEHWRGQRDEREWPTILRRGGQWPWTPETDRYEVIWRQIKQLREEFGEYLSYRTLAKDLGYDLNLVKRVLGRNKDAWTALNGESHDDPTE